MLYKKDLCSQLSLVLSLCLRALNKSICRTLMKPLRYRSADDDVVRCFIEATLKHSKAPGAVRASKKRYPFLRPVISRGCQG